jgi:hypothetical protein
LPSLDEGSIELRCFASNKQLASLKEMDIPNINTHKPIPSLGWRTATVPKRIMANTRIYMIRRTPSKQRFPCNGNETFANMNWHRCVPELMFCSWNTLSRMYPVEGPPIGERSNSWVGYAVIIAVLLAVILV